MQTPPILSEATTGIFADQLSWTIAENDANATERMNRVTDSTDCEDNTQQNSSA